MNYLKKYLAVGSSNFPEIAMKSNNSPPVANSRTI
jgi:hypothetical protein